MAPGKRQGCGSWLQVVTWTREGKGKIHETRETFWEGRRTGKEGRKEDRR